MDENTCGVLHFMCLIKWKNLYTHFQSQQNQTHLKYFETKSNKNLCKWDGGGEKGGEGRQAVEGGGRSSLWEPCTGAGGRRWRWIRWPPRGEIPPCLWWMGRLRSSAGAPRCRQTRKLMLKSGNKKTTKTKEELRGEWIMDKRQAFRWINGEYDEHYTRERPSICYLHTLS